MNSEVGSPIDTWRQYFSDPKTQQDPTFDNPFALFQQSQSHEKAPSLELVVVDGQALGDIPDHSKEVEGVSLKRSDRASDYITRHAENLLPCLSLRLRNTTIEDHQEKGPEIDEVPAVNSTSNVDHLDQLHSLNDEGLLEEKETTFILHPPRVQNIVSKKEISRGYSRFIFQLFCNIKHTEKRKFFIRTTFHFIRQGEWYNLVCFLKPLPNVWKKLKLMPFFDKVSILIDAYHEATKGKPFEEGIDEINGEMFVEMVNRAFKIPPDKRSGSSRRLTPLKQQIKNCVKVALGNLMKLEGKPWVGCRPQVINKRITSITTKVVKRKNNLALRRKKKLLYKTGRGREKKKRANTESEQHNRLGRVLNFVEKVVASKNQVTNGQHSGRKQACSKNVKCKEVK